MQSFLRVAIVACALGFTAQAQTIRTPLAVPPQVPEATAEVLRGKLVEIPLRAMGDPKGVRYRIRSNPRHGSVTLVTKEKGAVWALYKHSGKTGNDADRFTYAAQNGVGISAPANVTIKISDPPAALRVIEAVEFGTSFVGEKVIKEVLLENHGGSPLEGRLQTEPPWSIDGELEYRLAPGQTKKVRLLFGPKSEGDFNGQLRFSSDPARVTLLTATALYPIVANTRSMVLGETNGIRRGSLELTNRSNVSRVVKVLSGKELRVPSAVEVPSNGKTQLEIVANPDQPWRHNTSLTLVEGDVSSEIAVRASALDASLEVRPENLLFSKGGQLMLEVSNVGGMLCEVSVETSPPFEVDAADRSFRLSPGEKRTLEVIFKAEKPGLYRSRLVVKTERTELAIPVQGTSETTLTAPSQEPLVQSRTQSALAQPKSPEVKLAGLQGLRLASVKPSSAALEWGLPAAKKPVFKVECRRLVIEQTKPKSVWIALEQVTFSQKDGIIRGVVKGLRPGATYTLRVVYWDESGASSEPSDLLQFTTEQHFWAKMTWLQIFSWVAVFLVAALVYRRWRR